jgi:16S rRNA U1498 N3-methylase RsmE
MCTNLLAPELAGRTVDLDPAAAHHATRVLRLAIGDALTLFDGTGGEYAATLVRADKRGASVRVERFLPVERESPLALTLAQAIVASDAMDSAIRKATELGVTAIQPLVTARSAPMGDGERGKSASPTGGRSRPRRQSSRAAIAFRKSPHRARSPTGCRRGAGRASCCCRKRSGRSPRSRRRRPRSP